jgi:UDP-3-O-acyl-N-acetylglucosamine deacetylase
MSATQSDRLEAATVVYDTIPYLIAANTQIWGYENVAINSSGYAVPVSDTAGLIWVGYNTNSGSQTNNLGGAAGAFSVITRPIGLAAEDRYYQFDCSGATQSWVNSLTYFTDDHTVALSSSNSVKAGRVTQVLSSSVVIVDSSHQS